MITQICTTPYGQLAIKRTEALLKVIHDYPVLLRRFYYDREKQTDTSVTNRIFPDDIPAVLLAMIYGDESWLPTGMFRIYGTGEERNRIFLQRLDLSDQRLCVIPEYEATTTTRCIVYDFDGPNHSNPLKDALGSALTTHKYLTALGIPAHLVRSHSGVGYHLWVFFETAMKSHFARHIANHLLSEAINNPDECSKVEINPKMHAINSQCPSITLPWHVGAMPGHNTLITPGSGDILPLPENDSFALVSYKKLDELILRFPSITKVEESKQNTTGNNKYNNLYGNEKLIQQVYGNYLTGKIKNGKWLECHDPASPSGDRTPSAGVNIDSGYFNSFRNSGRKASILEMMVELGQARDIKDAMAIAEQVTGKKSKSWQNKPVFPYGQYMMPCDEIEPPTLTALSLEEARANLKDVVSQEIVPMVQRHEHNVSLIRAGTGVGKSWQFGELFAAIAKNQLLDEKNKPLRALYITHSRAKISELSHGYLRDKDGHRLPDVAIAYPRSKYEYTPGYCKEYEMAEHLCKYNQSVSALLCKKCQKDMRDEAKDKWKAMTKTERRKSKFKELLTPCPYQENRKQIENARVVVGVRHSFQHGGKLLEDFDLIVIDEQSEEAFFQKNTFNSSALSVWEHRMNKKTETKDILFPVLSVMKKALIAGPAEGFDNISNAIPLLPVLQKLDPEIGLKIYALDKHLQEIKWDGHSTGTPETAILGTFIDVPTLKELWEENETVPMCGIMTLISALSTEFIAGHPIADTRVWIKLPHGDDEGKIFTFMPRTHLIESLRKRVTVFLDATAYVPLMDKLFDNKLTVYSIPVKTNMKVHFYGDALYRWNDLKNGQWRLDALLHDIKRKSARFNDILFIGEKSAKEELEDILPKNIILEHWFSGEMAGSNRYEDCDAMICIGHPREPVDELVYRIAAMRWKDNLDNAKPEGNPGLFDVEGIIVPVAGFKDEKGDRWGRVIYYPKDSELQQYALHRYANTITQAVGRIRPATPGPPKEVFLYIGEPAYEMPVDQLFTLEKSLAWEDPYYLTMNPCPRKYGQEPTPQLAKPDKNAVPFKKYLKAAKKLRDEGKPISIYSLQRVVGNGTHTAARYYARVLEVLAIHKCRRQAMEAELGSYLNNKSDCLDAHFILKSLSQEIQKFADELTNDDWERMWLERAYYPVYQYGGKPRNAGNYSRAKSLFADIENEFQQWARKNQHRWESTKSIDDPCPEKMPKLSEMEVVEMSFDIWWASLSIKVAAAVVAYKMRLI
jgi:hypothetical protein